MVNGSEADIVFLDNGWIEGIEIQQEDEPATAGDDHINDSRSQTISTCHRSQLLALEQAHQRRPAYAVRTVDEGQRHPHHSPLRHG